MIKQIIEGQKWYVSVGNGQTKKEYIIDAQTNLVEESTLTQAEIDALGDPIPGDVYVASTALNAWILAPRRINDRNELALLVGHLDHLNLSQES